MLCFFYAVTLWLQQWPAIITAFLGISPLAFGIALVVYGEGALAKIIGTIVLLLVAGVVYVSIVPPAYC